jgi:very-short-patch-repair endonuclease
MALHHLAVLEPVAAQQHGLFTRAQARQLGLDDGAITHGLAVRAWHSVHRSVFRVAGSPTTWRSSLMAACLGGDALASHCSAAVLWGLDGFAEEAPEVSRRRGTNFRAPGVRSHESTDLPMAGRVVIDGIPTTGIARTLVDLGAVVPQWKVERAVDEAVRRRLLTIQDAWAVLIRHSRRGRRGCGKLRAVLNDRIPVGSTDSWFERLFLRALSDTSLPTPVTQHVVRDRAGYVVRVDVAWPEQKVAVELDGKAFHLNAEAFEHDAAVRNRLRLEGWVVLVVTWKMFTEQPFTVWSHIRRALDGVSPHQGELPVLNLR